MKISRKLEYACRVLAQLGQQGLGGSLVHIDRLSEAENIPSNYLVQILNSLRIKGLIVSKRGKQGGYALAKNPDQITLFAIVEAMDPESLKVSCGREGDSGAQVAEVWDTVSGRWIEALKERTLESLIAKSDSKMYYI
ncbi:MAG: Rrf2 family transcriptional regulator [Puniceicoccaceae bacterium]|nr:Rrf2 family transcriptional regulator [Puniceicoccaceae bacterium]RCL29866.1 MAG: Rrf2 family transcriptional regulator [Puniceicoccaceae bacterium]